MTLVEFADRITTGVQQVAQRAIIASHIDRLKRVAFNLSQVEPQVTEAVSLVQAARSSGLVIPTDRLEALRARVVAAGRGPAGECDVADYEEVANDLRTELSTVKSLVVPVWRELVDRKLPQLAGLAQLVDTFRRLDPNNALAGELGRAVTVAQHLAKSSPSTEAVAQLDAVADGIRRMLRDLVGDQESVRLFFERVGRGGAPLDSLTPEVKAWITAKGFDRAFIIVPGRPED